MKSFAGFLLLLLGCLNLQAQYFGINKANPAFRLDVYGIINVDSGCYYMGGLPLLRTAPGDDLFLGYAIVAGGVTGQGNTFIGAGAGTIVGNPGSWNTSIGRASTTEDGSYSVAVGQQASARFNNSIAIGSGATAPASNSIRLGDANITAIYAQTGITVTSDYRLKEKFVPVNGEEVLQKLAGLPLSSWNFKGQDPSKFRHYGPMAQDFYAAFGKDAYGHIGNDTTINGQDMEAINMIAIQALEKRTNRLTQLQEENEALKKRLSSVEATLEQWKKEQDSERALLLAKINQLSMQLQSYGVAGQAEGSH